MLHNSHEFVPSMALHQWSRALITYIRTNLLYMSINTNLYSHPIYHYMHVSQLILKAYVLEKHNLGKLHTYSMYAGEKSPCWWTRLWTNALQQKMSQIESHTINNQHIQIITQWNIATWWLQYYTGGHECIWNHSSLAGHWNYHAGKRRPPIA